MIEGKEADFIINLYAVGESIEKACRNCITEMYEVFGECIQETDDRLPKGVYEVFGKYIQETNVGDVVVINKKEDDNFKREGPVVRKSGDEKTGWEVDVHFEDHVKRYDLKDVSPTGQSIPGSTVDRLPKYDPINVPKK